MHEDTFYTSLEILANSKDSNANTTLLHSLLPHTAMPYYPRSRRNISLATVVQLEMIPDTLLLVHCVETSMQYLSLQCNLYMLYNTSIK